MANPPPVTLSEDRPAWQRQRRESAERYGWFRAYLEMPLPRSVRTLATRHAASADYLYHLSASGQWAERARLYDEDGQTQRDREVLTRQREQHATIADATARLTARCLRHASSVVDELPPAVAVARAFDGARTVHQMHAPATAPVQVSTSVTASAEAGAGAPLTEAEQQDAAHGRDAALYSEVLAAIRSDVRAEAAAHAPVRSADEETVQGLEDVGVLELLDQAEGEQR